MVYFFDINCYIYSSDLNQSVNIFKKLSTVEQTPLIENIIAKDYYGKPFKGPTSLVYNKDENVIYFYDSGNFGTASMCPFDCALYSINLKKRVLNQMLYKLSFIFDVAVMELIVVFM